MSTTRSTGLAGQFEQWSRAAHGTAITCQDRGDRFGAALATARSEVYALAAHWAKDLDSATLARQCADAEVAHHRWQGNPDVIPLGQEDSASLEHVKAMAWGLCARAVDSNHRPVERPW